MRQPASIQHLQVQRRPRVPKLTASTPPKRGELPATFTAARREGERAVSGPAGLRRRLADWRWLALFTDVRCRATLPLLVAGSSSYVSRRWLGMLHRLPSLFLASRISQYTHSQGDSTSKAEFLAKLSLSLPLPPHTHCMNSPSIIP